MFLFWNIKHLHSFWLENWEHLPRQLESVPLKKKKNGCKSPEIPLKHIRVLDLKYISGSRRAAGNIHSSSSAYEFPGFGGSELPARCDALQVIRSGYADGPRHLKFHHPNHFMSRSFMQLWSVWLSCGMADSHSDPPADWCPYTVDAWHRKWGDCCTMWCSNILMSGGWSSKSKCARQKIGPMNK